MMRIQERITEVVLWEFIFHMIEFIQEFFLRLECGATTGILLSGSLFASF
jgi:hypothetical protein